MHYNNYCLKQFLLGHQIQWKHMLKVSICKNCSELVPLNKTIASQNKTHISLMHAHSVLFISFYDLTSFMLLSVNLILPFIIDFLSWTPLYPFYCQSFRKIYMNNSKNYNMQLTLDHGRILKKTLIFFSNFLYIKKL